MCLSETNLSQSAELLSKWGQEYFDFSGWCLLLLGYLFGLGFVPCIPKSVKKNSKWNSCAVTSVWPFFYKSHTPGKHMWSCPIYISHHVEQDVQVLVASPAEYEPAVCHVDDGDTWLRWCAGSKSRRAIRTELRKVRNSIIRCLTAGGAAKSFNFALCAPSLNFLKYLCEVRFEDIAPVQGFFKRDSLVT